VGTKLYVGNLPYTTTEEQLSELFSKHGNVLSARVVTDKYTSRSRGFGFIEMSTPDEAQQAITSLDGTQMGGRALKVNEAKPQEKREGSYGGGGGGRGRREERW